LSDLGISSYENRLGTKASEPANWDRRLAWPVTVRGGGPIATLADARAFILNLPDTTQHRIRWQHAANLLLKAADSESDADIERATLEIERALIVDARLGRK
jgi:hypothetical protein